MTEAELLDIERINNDPDFNPDEDFMHDNPDWCISSIQYQRETINKLIAEIRRIKEPLTQNNKVS